MKKCWFIQPSLNSRVRLLIVDSGDRATVVIVTLSITKWVSGPAGATIVSYLSYGFKYVNF